MRLYFLLAYWPNIYFGQLTEMGLIFSVFTNWTIIEILPKKKTVFTYFTDLKGMYSETTFLFDLTPLCSANNFSLLSLAASMRLASRSGLAIFR